MIDLKTKTALVIDHGLYVELAVRLARDYGKVYYWSTSREAFPTSANEMIGVGLEGIERVGNEKDKDKGKDLYDYIDEADIVYFPDVYEGDFQAYLRKQGKRVWGSGKAERLELDRWFLKELLLSLGLPVLEAERIIGIDKLREALKKTTDKYVKISHYRGDFETFHYTNYKMFDEILDDIESRLGGKKKTMEFIVEEPTKKGAIEIGYDGFCIDGQFPATALYGYEIKDKAYCGVVKPYTQLPKFMQDLNTALGPTMKKLGMRGSYSNEIRQEKDGTPFLTDPTCRIPSPPGEAILELWSNLSEFTWEGAAGNMIELKPVGKYVALAEIHSRYAAKNWMPIEIPKENRQWIKFKYLCRTNDKYQIVPNFGDLIELGAVVGFGNTLEEAIKQVNKHSEGLDGYDLSIKVESLDEAQEVIDAGKKQGVQF